MLNVLIVYAVEEERVHVQMPQCKFHYCRTGVGKVSAALAVERSIAIHKPDVVLNIGTAGTLKYEIGSIHLCSKFVDRDMEKLQNFGVPFEEDFTDTITHCSFFKGWNFDSTCNTGDTFLTSADGTGDVFDMESFAVARVCKVHNIPFVGIKCVTDIIGQNSIKHWEDKLAEAQVLLQNFVDNNHLSVSENFIGEKAQHYINSLELDKHPEGGWFKEVYRSNMKLDISSMNSDFSGDRDALTSIHYLLVNEEISSFHKIKSPEVWYFHDGMPLIIHMIDEKGNYNHIELSEEMNGKLQYTVEPNIWFSAEIKEGCGYTLVSCAVAPGFDFEDFEIGKRDELVQQFPSQKDIIRRLTF
ncbi:cupin domain-containing protein [Labilibacter marinus]|uniref:cupin domain-containing protein n=1 Tax=Labilibacter marinus TaxID=1477105 RepID=UPI00094F77E0|nr:cupin domain-containing protein [Labilibacter marinus]